MNLKELIKESNSLADDLIPEDEVKSFVNDAIALIGQDQYATFPSLEDMEDVPVIPDKWQRMLIIPYTVGRIKQKDSSQFEWEGGYSQFYANIAEFSTTYRIPKQYLDLEYPSTISVNGQPYEIESGDTLYIISERENVSVSQLLSENEDNLRFVNTSYNDDVSNFKPHFWSWGGEEW